MSLSRPPRSSLRPPSLFLLCVFLTVAASAIWCVGANVTALLLVLVGVLDFLIVAVWGWSAFGWGGAVIKTLRRPERYPRGLTVITAIALGLGVESLLVLGFGLAGGANTLVGWAIVLGGGLLGVWARDLLLVAGIANLQKLAWASCPCSQDTGKMSVLHQTNSRGGAIPDPHWLEKASRFFWLLPIAVLTFDCIGALLPPGLLWGDEPNGYDVVEYHFQVPREWFEAGRILPLTHNVFSYFPFNVEMHYLLAMLLRHGPWAGMYTAQLMHVAFVALAAAAVYALVAERSKAAATLAATAVAMTPWYGLLAPVAYDEGGMLLWGTLAIGLLLRGDGLLAGVMAGFACGAKWTAVPVVLLAAPIAATAVRIISIRALAMCWLAGLLVLSPWLIRNWVWTRNPVFPEATSVFGKAAWSGEEVDRWRRANHEPRLEHDDAASRAAGRAAVLRSEVVGRAGELWSQVIGDWRYDFLLIPLGLAAAIATFREPRTWMLLACLGVLLIFWIGFTHLQSRFFVLAIPIVGLLIGGVQSREMNAFAIVTLVMGAIGLGGLLLKIHALDGRLFNLIGLQKVQLLTPLIDTDVPSDARVELIGDAKAFWYQVPMTRLKYRTVFDVDAKPNQSAIEAWSAGWGPWPGETIRVIDPGELERFARTYWKIPMPSRDVEQMPGPTVIRQPSSAPPLSR